MKPVCYYYSCSLASYCLRTQVDTLSTLMYVFNDHCWWLNHLGFNLMTCNGGNSGSTQLC